MGGGGRYPYPKNVWTPAGGWWCHPRAWKSNTMRCAGAISVLWVAGMVLGERYQYSKQDLLQKPYTSKMWMGGDSPTGKESPTAVNPAGSWPRSGIRYQASEKLGGAPTLA